MYGDPAIHPQTEDYWGNVNPIGPRSCYEEGKRCAETLFFDYHRQHCLKIKVARIFNTYGPRMHPNDGRVVSNFIVQALKGEPISIYGDGSQTRAPNAAFEREAAVKRFLGLLVFGLFCLGSAFAQDTKLPLDELSDFRATYTAGKGLAYVVVRNDKGETVYRYGDASREAAKRDKRGFMLFTCSAPRAFVIQDPRAVESLKNARVVKAGEPEFAELDRKYMSGCRNPMVRSALPKQP